MDEAPPRIRSKTLAAGLADVDQPCHACGHNLRGLEEVFCPECGTVIAAPIPQKARPARPVAPAWVRWWRRGNSLAAGLVLVVAFARLSGLSAAPAARAAAGGLTAAATMACAALVLHLAAGARLLLGAHPAGRASELLLAALGTGLVVFAALSCR